MTGTKYRFVTTNRDGEKMFLTNEGRWSEYAFAAELFDHVPECSDPNSFYGTPMKVEVVPNYNNPADVVIVDSKDNIYGVVLGDGSVSETSWGAEQTRRYANAKGFKAMTVRPRNGSDVKTILLGDANHARIKVVTNAGMILIAPYFAVVMHDDGALFSHRWLMRHNLIENTEFCTHVKPDTIKTVEYIK